eukprot:5757241-Pleurochrysis_carterae.AAC.1
MAWGLDPRPASAAAGTSRHRRCACVPDPQRPAQGEHEGKGVAGWLGRRFEGCEAAGSGGSAKRWGTAGREGRKGKIQSERIGMSTSVKLETSQGIWKGEDEGNRESKKGSGESGEAREVEGKLPKTPKQSTRAKRVSK